MDIVVQIHNRSVSEVCAEPVCEVACGSSDLMGPERVGDVWVCAGQDVFIVQE